MDREVDVLRQIGAAAAAGDAELVETLGPDVLYYIHEMNGLGYFRSDCPLALGG